MEDLSLLHPGERVRIDADAAADGVGTLIAPASVIVEGTASGSLRLRACGSPREVDGAAAGARRVDRSGCVLLPALVNAHTHLDLTHIGPKEYEPARGFMGFVANVLPNRLKNEASIAASVRRGAELSRAGGVVAVGDIAGVVEGAPSLAASRALDATGLLGVSYVEFFAIGNGEERNLAALGLVIGSPEWRAWRGERVRLGVSPHAPYTVSAHAFERALAMTESPVCTHLAENAEEREFIGRGAGPFRDFHDRLGLWNDTTARSIGRGLDPIEHMRPVLRRGTQPMLLAHVNDCDDAGLATIAASGASVAYCPRSSAYFLNHESFGPHRYRDMLRAGINVCLGTDSVINITDGTAAGFEARLSTLDEARFLLGRDGTSASTLLKMATVNGALALGLDPALFTLSGGPKHMAGLICVEAPGRGGPLDRVLSGTTRPQLIRGTG
ncbi:MAG TPA: amidohydrolase family protein [Phycisphaerales bacterium]|nr:amidohydrolase family protein [Phycisphaerales bacterium]